jgi:hypothetical protein
MNYETAIRILDRVKEGHLYPLKIINMALVITGDLDEKQ